MADEHDSWLAVLGITGLAPSGGNQPVQATAPPPNPPSAPAAGGATPPAAGGSAQPVSGGAAPPAGDGGNYAQGVADRIATKIKAHTDLKFDIAMLSNMDMPTLLDVMDRLKRAGVLDEFATGENQRIGVAILTVQGQFDAPWQGLFAKLKDADKQAILARVPDKIRASLGATAPGGGAAPSKPGDPAVDTKGVVGVGPGGVEVVAKLTFHSDYAGSLGETEFSIHIGPDGKLSQLEADITAIKIPKIEEKIAALGAPASLLQLEATLSFNSTVNIDQQAGKAIFGKLQVQAQAELEAHFKSKRIPGLQKIAFKLTATGGSGGFSGTFGVEIPIPGS